MRSPSPAFSFYPKDWLSDSNVKAMSIDAKGAYIELLSIYWLEDGLPADTDRLSRLVGISPAKFRHLWPLIEPCFSVKGSRLVQKRLERERAKQKANSRLQSARGKKGGRPMKSTTENTQRFRPAFPDESRSKPKKSLPSPSPLRITTDPPSPPADAGGPVENPNLELPPGLTGNGGLPPPRVGDRLSDKAERQTVNDIRRYAISIGFHPRRKDLRQIKEWVHGGRTMAVICDTLDTLKAEGHALIVPRQVRL